MDCPNCLGGAVVTSPMRNAPVKSVHTCSVCGLRWSDEPCASKGCPRRAIGECVNCAGFKCANHGGDERICDACRKRLKAVITPTRWSRTGRLSQ